MQAIRRKIWWVIILLIAAMAVSTVIYSNGGFSITSSEGFGVCGNVGFTENLSDIARQGKTLYKANCTSCHAMDKELTGPALAGVMKRLPSEKLMREILWYPDETFKKNKYARALYKKYRTGHTVFRDVLTKEDIEAIIAYFNAYKAHPYQDSVALP